MNSGDTAGGVERIACGDGGSIAYRHSPGAGPGVVFLGGFRSDMTGTKAVALEEFCRRRGRAFVRFDYFAHGESAGEFAVATIGRWKEDAVLVLDRLTQGPQILVGSSMGGWLMVLAALARPSRIAALVGIAAAPDFTEDLLWPRLGEDARRRLIEEGEIRIPTPYDPAGYLVTRRLIEEARGHLVLRRPIPLLCPVRLLHGMADADVPWRQSLALAERLESRDVTLTLVKGAGHRLSEPADLARLCDVLGGLF